MSLKDVIISKILLNNIYIFFCIYFDLVARSCYIMNKSDLTVVLLMNGSVVGDSIEAH